MIPLEFEHLLFVILINSFDLFSVFVDDLGNDHLVVSLLAVLKEDREHLPDASDDAIGFGLVLDDVFDHVEEADGVDEEAPVNAINELI